MKVICVDDEQIALDEMKEALRTCPEVTAAEYFLSPLDALEWLKANPADAAFLDIRMSPMDGLSLAKAIRELRPRCSVVFVTAYDQYAVTAFRLHATGYLMKPFSAGDVRSELEYIKNPQQPPAPTQRARAQTFGNFEFFIDDHPVKFRYSKTKELLAYLVDRQGASCNTAELCAVLWEDAPDTPSLRSQLRNLISDLSHILQESGVEDLFVKRRNSFCIDTKRLDCDMYRFQRKDIAAINSYFGEYMTQYPWAELRIGYLDTRS
ncbi:MAG: response regulator [Bacillota bacterium]|nr:response regulator [Bacillota bacterium]